MKIKHLITILIVASLFAVSNNASAWSYSRTASGSYNGNSYSRSVYASGNGYGYRGGYGCGGYGGWYGTGIPNGLGWTMFGVAAAGAFLGGAQCLPPPVCVPPPNCLPYPTQPPYQIIINNR
jgi:hypothetical protein